jgi:hypothetical protein
MSKSARTQDVLSKDFWGNVEIGNADECWPWLRSRCGLRGEYGTSYFEGHRIGAHRLAYILTYGPIPDKMEVCHKCDNPICCNPSHLWLGTHHENMLDCHDKGRRKYASKGSAHPISKLTEADIPKILKLAQSGLSRREIGERFRVSDVTITYIVQGKTWKHVPRQLSIFEELP